tara:strand:- start:78 stop:686 length:609 start_codon:yes stop_codon:yes gene_type:complete
MTIYFGDGSTQTAAASGGFWETAHRQLYTGDSVNDTHLITGLGSYDMLKVYFTVTVTGGSKNNPLPNIQIGTSSGLNTEQRYHSAYRSGYSGSYSNTGSLATHWFPNENPSDKGDPGNDYSAIMVWGDMTIYNWKEDDYYTHGCWVGGYTTEQQNEGGCAPISGAVSHRVKMENDRMQFSWESGANNDLKKMQVIIQGATYS